MKPIYLLIPLFVVGIGLFTAQAAQIDESGDTVVVEEQPVSIAEGVDIVIATVEELKGAIKLDSNNNKKINQLSKKLDEKWDLIEKKVEKQYPKDYITIERSLYPLIGEAAKTSPSIKTIEQLIPETIDKLIQFKEKVQ